MHNLRLAGPVLARLGNSVAVRIRFHCVHIPECAIRSHQSEMKSQARSQSLRGFGRLIAGLVLLLISVVGVASAADATSKKWSTPVEIEGQIPAGGSLNLSEVSCSSSTFCVAVDSLGAALFWHGSNWSGHHHVNANGSLDSVSCPSTTYCVVVSDAGKAVTYNGGAWTPSKTIGPEDSYRISCPSVSFCAAVGANGLPGKPSTIATFNGHSWSSHLTSTSGKLNDRLLGVSCASATYCVAVNYNGQILNFNGSRWSAIPTLGPKGLTSVSCASSSFCLAVTASGESIVIHRTKWSGTATIPGFQGGFAYSVSCASSRDCVVAGLDGQIDTWLAGKWSKPVKVFAGRFNALVSTSCSHKGYCMVITSSGKSSFINQ